MLQGYAPYFVACWVVGYTLQKLVEKKYDPDWEKYLVARRGFSDNPFNVWKWLWWLFRAVTYAGAIGITTLILMKFVNWLQH